MIPTFSRLVRTCRPTVVIFASAFAVASGVSVTVVAPSALAASDSEIESAKAAISAGRALKRDGDLPGARDRFKAAWALVPTPRIGVELAETHEALGELVEARRIYSEVSRLPPIASESTESIDARRNADAHATSLKARIPTLTVRLLHAPDGSAIHVTVDRAEVPLDALTTPRLVNPGSHVVVVLVVVAAEPQRTQTKTLTLAEGQHEAVEFDLTRDAADEPKVASPAPTEPASGAHARSRAPSPAPDAPRGHGDSGVRGGDSTLMYLGFGLAGAGIVFGSVTGLVASSKASQLKTDCPDQRCGPDHHDELTSARTFGTLSTISFAAAGVGLVLGIVGLASGPQDPSKASAIEPWIGLASVGVRGAF